ncbi:MAG: hypothetical protein JRM85_09125 [Nitrososphaerota archaeon]|nr:hypothetical protein [Nitrososphaerota archaeon]
MTFEEAERRRAALSKRPQGAVGRARFLLAAFVVLTVALVYLIAAPYAGELSNDYAATAGVGALGGLALLGLRFSSYRKVHGPPGSLSLAFLDVMAWVGVVGVVVWSFVFPVMHPFPADTVLYLFYLPQFPIGVYSLTFLWAMLIVFRVALQPFTKPPSERVFADIESTLRKLTDTVNKVGLQMKGDDQKVDPALAEKVTSIMSEITAVRKDLSGLKTAAPAVYTAPAAASVSSVRVMAPQPRQAAPPKVQVAASPAAPEIQPRAEGGTGVAVPESAVDNPWLNVLAKRRAKAASDG